MNIQFNIDWHGHLDISQYVREAEPKQRNTEVRSAIYGRTDQNKIELYLDDDAEYAPLVRLLDFLRAIKNPDVTIYSGHGSIDNNRQYADPNPFSKQADLFLFLGKLSLFAFEKTSQSQFSSHLSIFPPQLSVADTLPFMFLNLGQIYRLNESSSNSLKQIDTEILDHATIFSLDANHLCKPESIASICDFPEQLQQLEIVELMQTDYGRWIDLVARTSLSIRQPLLQFGTLKEQSLGDEDVLFYRAIIPFVSHEDQPKNFRVLILTFAPQRQIWGL